MWHRTVGCIITFTLSLLAASLVAEAQPPGKVYRIGWLSENARPGEAYLEALRALGYVEGHNLVVERRYAKQEADLPALAAELVTRQVDLLMTFSTAATRAAQQATATIPIVFRLGTDPVQSGLVASSARPGGNLTGVAFGLYPDKQLAILKEALPGMVRVAFLCGEDVRTHPAWDQFADTARGLGVEILVITVDGPDGFDDFFAAARRAGADAVLVAPLPWLPPHFRRLGELVAQSRFPAIGPSRLFAEGGGLFFYGQKQGESISRFAAQVDKVLKGAKPADLPVEQPMRFELVINLKTAKALGLTIPPVVMFQADEVIQ
jgi:putative tryptophan/tyrosine transport system substrate-binding protein